MANYTWDVENRLTMVQLSGDGQGNPGAVVSFKYDPFGRRIQKSSSSATTTYVYDGANITSEYDGAGSLVAKYEQERAAGDESAGNDCLLQGRWSRFGGVARR